MAIKTIGSGGDYADINAWVTWLQSVDPLSEDQTGRVLESGISTTSTQVISGVTQNGFSIVLEAAPDASFRDAANGAPNNALLYSASYAFVRRSSGSGRALEIDQAGVVTVRNLQFDKDGGFNQTIFVENNGTPSIVNCIIKVTDSNTALIFRRGTLENCLIHVPGKHGVQLSTGGGSVLNCTIINTGAAGSTVGIDRDYGTWTVKNTAVFGFNTNFNGTCDTSANNATSAASFSGTGWGTSGQVSAVAATEFQGATTDFRLASGSAKLKNNGTATGTPSTDVFGQTRTTPDIGCFELQEAAAAGLALPRRLFRATPLLRM